MTPYDLNIREGQNSQLSQNQQIFYAYRNCNAYNMTFIDDIDVYA